MEIPLISDGLGTGRGYRVRAALFGQFPAICAVAGSFQRRPSGTVSGKTLWGCLEEASALILARVPTARADAYRGTSNFILHICSGHLRQGRACPRPCLPPPLPTAAPSPSARETGARGALPAGSCPQPRAPPSPRFPGPGSRGRPFPSQALGAQPNGAAFAVAWAERRPRGQGNSLARAVPQPAGSAAPRSPRAPGPRRLTSQVTWSPSLITCSRRASRGCHRLSRGRRRGSREQTRGRPTLPGRCRSAAGHGQRL